jgi:hypothetical protein
MNMAAKKQPEPTYEELLAENAGLRGDVESAEHAFERENIDHRATISHLDKVELKNAKLQDDVTFERERANALEKRLQRMSGYLDRVMDEENSEELATEVVRARPAPKGPRVSKVNMPTRASSRLAAYPSIEGAYDPNPQYPERTY